jgi:hypothetical protein
VLGLECAAIRMEVHESSSGWPATRGGGVMVCLSPSSTIRRTLELSCEAPIVPGFVSFNSLFGNAARPGTPLPSSRNQNAEHAPQ